MKARIIDKIIETEGGYVDDPLDSGGETNFGITVARARASGYLGSMRGMPRDRAFDIYAREYWDAVKADKLLAMSESMTEEVVDTSVNMGPGRAGKFLQRALNVLSEHETLVVDGDIGPATLAALGAYLLLRDERTLCKALNCLQGAYYIKLAERREKDRRFVYGWLKNRVEL